MDYLLVPTLPDSLHAYRKDTEMIKRTPLITTSLILYLAFFSISVAFSKAPQEPKNISVLDSENNVNIETTNLLLKITPKGDIIELFDKIQKKSLLVSGEVFKFMVLKENDNIKDLISLTRSDDYLKAEFEGSNLKAFFELKVRNDSFSFELVSVSTKDFEYIEFIRLPVGIYKYIADVINFVYDDYRAIGVLAATKNTNVDVFQKVKNGILFGARCWSDITTDDVKAIVIGCETKKILDSIEKIEVEYDLPHPQINGKWVKRTSENQKSYLLSDISFEDIEKAISYAKEGGIDYIVLLDRSWVSSRGHYKVRTKKYPHGLQSLKMAVDRIHSNEIKAGIHLLSPLISRNDAYLTPIPDNRLSKKASGWVLNERIDNDNTLIQIKKDPSFDGDATGDSKINNVIFQIENELLSCEEVKEEESILVINCQRGQYGTNATPHEANLSFYQLAYQSSMFLPDPKTNLINEIAENIAITYDYCGFDMIYFDGNAKMRTVGPGWYTMGLLHQAFSEHVKGEVMWQGSGMSHYSWHFFNRGTCNDYVCLDPKSYCDQLKVGTIKNHFKPNLIPVDLGWWGYFTHSDSHYATLPDEIRYMCAKAIAWDAACNLTCDLESMDKNGRTDETLEIMKNWQTLREQGFFSDQVKEELKQAEMDFRLAKGSNGGWRVQQIKYQKDHIVDPAIYSTKTWSINNQMGEGPLAFRLRALTELSHHDDEKNILLFGSTKKINIENASNNVAVETKKFDSASDPVLAGYEMSVSVGKGALRGWSVIGHQFDNPVNAIRHRVPSLWINGDGKGETVNVQLLDDLNNLRDHYIDIDFKGWRKITLDTPETRRVWDFYWPYNKKFPLKFFNYDKLSAIKIYLSNIKAQEKYTIQFGDIVALNESESKVDEFTFTIGEHKMVVPLAIYSDEYVECWANGQCKHFSPDGDLISNFDPTIQEDYSAITVPVGNNMITYDCRSNARARITVMVAGSYLN